MIQFIWFRIFRLRKAIYENKTKIYLIVNAFLIAALIVFIVINKKVVEKKELNNVEKYSKLLARFVWVYDEKGPQELIKVMVDENEYKEILINNSGKQFIKTENELEPALDRFLFKLGLISLKEYSTEILYKNSFIGILKIIKYDKNIYVYMQLFFVLALLSILLRISLSYFERRYALELANKKLIETARHAGIAEISSHILHNVGNILNSVGITTQMLRDNSRNSSVEKVKGLVGYIEDNKNDQYRFLFDNEEGRNLFEYLKGLVNLLSDEKIFNEKNLSDLKKYFEHIRGVIKAQQEFPRGLDVLYEISPKELVNEAISINAGLLEMPELNLNVRCELDEPLHLDKYKILQILLNLLSNAKYAVLKNENQDRKQIDIFGEIFQGNLRFIVRDNGIGISKENLGRVFTFGFTTKKEGHGYGLHSAIITAKEMNGRLTAQSMGEGLGATFVLEIPVVDNKHKKHKEN